MTDSLGVHTLMVDGPGGPLEVHVQGSGSAVLMIPSLGRGASDFDDLALRISAAGYQAICPEPRGIGGSTSSLDGFTMADLADDIAAVIRSTGAERATLVGHAFGNRVARMTATRHPELVERVVLLACGGLVPPAAEASAALRNTFDPQLSEAEHLEAVRAAFFAPGNDPAVWHDGWHGAAAAAQAVANMGTPVETWWGAGSAEVFVVQPAEDVIASVENGQDIVGTLGDRASMTVIADAAHALLPEQPEAVAVALLDWLDNRFDQQGAGG